LLQREVPIGDQDSVGSLYFERLYPLGVELLVEAVRQVREGVAPRIPQDAALATYEPPIEDEHAVVDWARPGRAVFNHVRGCDPQPGARALLKGSEVRLFNARYADAAPPSPPGTVSAVHEDGGIDVSVIGGTLSVGRLQADGAPKAAARELASLGDVLERLL
jgi:methionyl-tRNA formyltransferase